MTRKTQIDEGSGGQIAVVLHFKHELDLYGATKMDMDGLAYDVNIVMVHQ
jgi:hypothetical protein